MAYYRRALDGLWHITTTYFAQLLFSLYRLRNRDGSDERAKIKYIYTFFFSVARPRWKLILKCLPSIEATSPLMKRDRTRLKR